MKRNRRFLCAVGATVVAFSMFVGGAFAWADNHQHKTNVLTGGNKTEPNDVILVEDFPEPPDWQEGDELKKEIWVKNTGDGQIFVRLQLKEYMDIAAVTYTYSDELLLVDKDGKFVSANTVAALKAWLDENGVDYTDAQFKQYTAYGSSEARYYFATDGTTPINGKYGKKLLLDYTQGAPASLVPGVARGGYEETNDHQSHPTSECLYTPHPWDASADPFHEYVEWGLGAPLIKLSDWDGQPVAAWILDDSNAEGWAYWGEALRPGDGTAKLLETVTLVKQPDGPFYYAIHVDMQAADLYQLKSEFTGMPDKISDSFRGRTGFSVIPDVQSAYPGGRVRFQVFWDGAELAPGDVTWTVSNVDAASLNTQTRFSAPGLLRVGDGQSSGKLLVTAAYTGPEGAKTRQVIITVKQPAP